MQTLTADDQWRSLALNLGTWEGNLCRYDPDGNVKNRQGTVLFIYVETTPDEPEVKVNRPPSAIRLRLHRCGELRNADVLYLSGKDFVGSGMVYDPDNGHMCSAFLQMSSGGGWFFEQGLNYRDEIGNIVARARLLTIFDAERLQAFSVFRERPCSLSPDIREPTVPTSVINSDLVATEAEATVETLCGRWHGSLTRLRKIGNEVEMSRESYVARTRVEGNEIVMEGPLGGVGTVGENRKTVMFVDGPRNWRLVFLGGGVTAMTSLAVPRSDEGFFVELGWLVRPDLRMRTWRRYVGSTWVESCFAEEVAEKN